MDLCRHPDFFFLSISSFSILVYFKGTLYFLKPDLDFFFLSLNEFTKERVRKYGK